MTDASYIVNKLNYGLKKLTLYKKVFFCIIYNKKTGLPIIYKVSII